MSSLTINKDKIDIICFSLSRWDAPISSPALSLAKELGKTNRVFVLSIPDWGVSPYAAGGDKARVSREIDQFNTIAQEECQKAGITYIDITSISRSAAGDNSQFASDGLHYSGKQMKQWAEKALPVAKALIKK